MHHCACNEAPKCERPVATHACKHLGTKFELIAMRDISKAFVPSHAYLGADCVAPFSPDAGHLKCFRAYHQVHDDVRARSSSVRHLPRCGRGPSCGKHDEDAHGTACGDQASGARAEAASSRLSLERGIFRRSVIVLSLPPSHVIPVRTSAQADGACTVRCRVRVRNAIPALCEWTKGRCAGTFSVYLRFCCCVQEKRSV